MPLVSMRQLLDHAAENGYGIPAFNVNNLEQVQAVMTAADEVGAPVILQASAGARKYAGEPFIKHLIQAALESWPKVPLVMHQDHGQSPDVCKGAIDLGFSSVMMDGSLQADGKTIASYDYNVDVTRKVVDMAPAIGSRIVTNTADNAAPPPAGFYALAAIPARQALERNAWKEAAALTARESAFPWADAITHYARALGAARSGDPKAAAADIEKLTALAAALKGKNDAYWANQVDIQRRAATAWMLFAQGRRDEAIAEAREAAAMEDATEKSAVTPGPIKPARELLGEMLLEMGRAADALSAFEQTMTREPNRFRSIEGAARAAQASGDTAKARSYYAKLIELCPRGDRPDLEAARKAAGRR